MEIKGIKYISPTFDYSGYGKASRGNILALHNAGIPVTVSPISFEKEKSDLGEEGRIIRELVNKDIDYNIVIMHSTPEFWNQLKEAGKTNVGYTIWETSKLHKDWSGYINDNAAGIMVGSLWNKTIFKDSGVEVPVGVVPHGIDTSMYEDVKPFNIKGVKNDAYVFYSIFQWTERKNGMGLLKTYWHTFQNDENVALVLKTYMSGYSDKEKEAIKNAILTAKKLMPMDKYPPIYLIPNMLSEEELAGLHARGDCYVSLDRGEGFGLNPFTAGAFGNPVIITNYGGASEYTKSGYTYNVAYSLSPVSNMPWSPWYRGDQLWAEPDLYDASEKMHVVYENQEEAKNTGLKLRKYIKERFSWERIGGHIVEFLEEL